MQTRLTISVTQADDEIRAYLGGTNGNIPIVAFGPELATDASIAINTHLLTPAEQAAWLRRLADAARNLADQVGADESIIAWPVA